MAEEGVGLVLLVVERQRQVGEEVVDWGAVEVLCSMAGLGHSTATIKLGRRRRKRVSIL